MAGRSGTFSNIESYVGWILWIPDWSPFVIRALIIEGPSRDKSFLFDRPMTKCADRRNCVAIINYFPDSRSGVEMVLALIEPICRG